MAFAPKFRHSGVMVKRLDKARNFYEQVLGFEVEEEKKIKGAWITKLLGFYQGTIELTYIKYTTGLEILYFSTEFPQHWTPPNASHVAFTVKDLDNFYELHRKNILFLSEPMITLDKKRKVVFCEDWDGNKIELVEEL